jgi:hypothetical protein
MGIPFRFQEPDYLPLVRVNRDPRSVGLRARLVTPDVDTFRIYEQPNVDLPRLVMNRDSMGIALMPMLSENFRWSVYILSTRLERRTIDKERPDIVIDEIVERGMARLSHRPPR